MRRAARVVIQDQLNQIRQAKDGVVCRMMLKVDEPASPDCFPRLRITLRKADQSSIEVRTNNKDGALLGEADLEAGENFVVTYFDMPMVDYTAVLSSVYRWRYSVVLYETVAGDNAADIAAGAAPRQCGGRTAPVRL